MIMHRNLARFAVIVVASLPLLAQAEGTSRMADSNIISEIKRRGDALDRRERELNLREAQIAAADQLARREIAVLTALRAAVEKEVAQQTQAAEADVSLLVQMYSNMKPVQAATVFGKLEPPKVAAILKRIEPTLAGPIIAAMDPAVAAAVTDELQKTHAAFLP